jgi:hypothetical protein
LGVPNPLIPVDIPFLLRLFPHVFVKRLAQR